MTYMTKPLHKDPCLGGHKINNLRRPFLVIIIMYLVCLIYFLK